MDIWWCRAGFPLRSSRALSGLFMVSWAARRISPIAGACVTAPSPRANPGRRCALTAYRATGTNGSSTYTATQSSRPAVGRPGRHMAPAAWFRCATTVQCGTIASFHGGRSPLVQPPCLRTQHHVNFSDCAVCLCDCANTNAASMTSSATYTVCCLRNISCDPCDCSAPAIQEHTGYG